MNTLSFSTLGRRGRWGNQLFQFAFARAYAQTKGLTLCVPGDWIGRQLFRVPELDTVGIIAKRIDLDEVLCLGQWDQWINNLAGCDIVSYCQHQNYLDFYTRAQCRDWFQLIPPWDEYEKALIASLPRDYVAVHKRRGDYLRPPFNRYYAAVTNKSYDQALKQFGLSGPVMWVEEGWREPSQNAKDAGVPFLDDFLIMKNAKHLLRSNSSFSYWSGVLSSGEVYAPIVGNNVGWTNCGFIKGNWPKTANFPNQSDLRLKE